MRRAALKRALIVLGAVVLISGAIHLLSPEGLDGLVLNAAFSGQTDTAWAPTYSWWGFSRVRIGDTQAQVVQVAGEPLAKAEEVRDGKLVIYWMYTVSPTKSHFHMRRLLFDESGRVVTKVSEFYVD